MTTRVAPHRVIAPANATQVAARPREGTLGAKVAHGVILLLIFAVVFELTCRVEDWVRFRTPFFTPVTSQSDLMQHDEHGIHGRPGARFQKWVMNALGTRGPEASFAKPAGTVRIVTVGASETFGLSESPGREFPRQLEDSLNARLSANECLRATTTRFEVLNAALPGMSLPTIEQDVRNRVVRFGADFIVLYPTPAQYLFEEPPRPARPDSSARAGELSPTGAFRPRMLNRLRNQAKTMLPSFVATWLRRRDTQTAMRNRPPGWRFETLPPDRLEQYRRDLEVLAETVRATGAIPVFMTHANAFMQPGFEDRHLLYAWERFHPRATGPVIVAFDSAARHVTLEVAREANVIAVDAAAHLVRQSDGIFSDFSHFTDLGAARVASVLAPALHGATAARSGCEAES